MTSTSLMKEDLLSWQDAVRNFEEGEMDESYKGFCDMTEQSSAIVFNMATVHLVIGNFQDAYGVSE